MPNRRYQSARLIEKKKRKRVIMISLSIILFILLIFGISYLINLKTFHIEEIEINELRFVDKEEVLKIAQQNIEGKYLWLFSKSNSIIFPRSDIEKEIKEKYTSAKRVDADFAGFKKIKINIIEHNPVAKWCDVEVQSGIKLEHQGTASSTNSAIPQIEDDTSDSNCFFLNEDGMVFVEEPEIHAGQYISFFGLINKNEEVLGQNFSNQKKFKEILELVKLIRRLDISSSEVWSRTGEVFTIVTEPGARLHIDNEDDIFKVFQNLETVIKQDAINKAQFRNIDYIDLRFGNRVFYRLK